MAPSPIDERGLDAEFASGGGELGEARCPVDLAPALDADGLAADEQAIQ